VDNFILVLGFEVNFLPKYTWELMGKPKLVWSLVQLRLANQHKIVPISHLTRVERLCILHCYIDLAFLSMSFSEILVCDSVEVL
jgi:hypothetical protein